MVTILEDIDPGYYNDLIYLERCGRKGMYAESKKAIYVTLVLSGPAHPNWRK